MGAFEGTPKLSDEYDRISNVCQRYAVHRARGWVGFVCRKQSGGGGSSGLNTMGIVSVKRLRLIAKERDLDGDCGGDSDDDE